MKKFFQIAVIIFIALGAQFCVNQVWASDATSSSFMIRQMIDFISGRPTSTSFWGYQSQGGSAIGISTSSSFWMKSGFLFPFLVPFKPQYEQIHFHWRNDDGSETAATSATSGNEDTTVTNVIKSTIKRLRVGITNSGGTKADYSSRQFRLEYALQGGGCSSASYTDVGAVGGDWDMISSQLSESSDTTNIAVSTGGVSDSNNSFLVTNGGQRETTSQIGSLSLASDKFVELEFSIQALSGATDGETYCFRVTNAGSSSNFLYTKYAIAMLSGSTMTCTTATSSTAFGTLSPLSIGTASPNATTTMTCGGAGCALYMKDVGNTTSSGLYKSSSVAYLIASADATLSAGNNGYGAQSATTTAGSGAVLTLDSKYAKTGNNIGGFTLTDSIVANSSAPITGREVIITHKAAISDLTVAGSYADTITYSCIAN